MQYYAISEIELKQFHMAGLVAGGGDAVLPVVDEIRGRKISYTKESAKPAQNTARDAIALVCEIKRQVDLFGHYHVTSGAGDYERISAVVAQQHP